jgi:carbon storage regulator
MLVLSRRSRQSIVIGGRVKVTVLTIAGNHVEIGVEAPLHISVDREEVHARKQGPVRHQEQGSPRRVDRPATEQLAHSRATQAAAPSTPQKSGGRPARLTLGARVTRDD